MQLNLFDNSDLKCHLRVSMMPHKIKTSLHMYWMFGCCGRGVNIWNCRVMFGILIDNLVLKLLIIVHADTIKLLNWTIGTLQLVHGYVCLFCFIFKIKTIKKFATSFLSRYIRERCNSRNTVLCVLPVRTSLFI